MRGFGEGVADVSGRHRLTRSERDHPVTHREAASAREADTETAVGVGQTGVAGAVTGLMVRVRGLTVAYGEVTALAAVEAQFRPGSVTAVTGASGAGKSSLLWAVAGALDRGSVCDGVVEIDALPVVDRSQTLGMGVALLPQGNGLASVLTAGENCLVPLLEMGVPAADAVTRVEEVLTAVGLEDSGNHLIEELSGGQQQRVAVARALAVRPRLLLADEPTSELDHGNRERVLALLHQLAEGGATVVMATHDPEAAAGAPHELGLGEGRVVSAR